MINIELKVLKALLKFINKKDGRHCLHGIYIDPEGYLVSTNGHAMAVYALNTLPEIEEGLTIPVDVIEGLVKSLPGKVNYECLIHISKDEVRVGDTTLKYTPLYGKYVAWRVPIPSYNEGGARTEWSFNHKYLWDIHSAFKYISGGTDLELNIKATFPDGKAEIAPTKFTCFGVEVLTIYLMNKRV